ncbi:MAG: hypothetical protein LCI00_33620 [Chloroflexi bacterium]|nr:hypothetical protein [Chloroflexota bacterium]MCC6894037.1 hypothetical protein [Anaerolineae bacterium]
MTTLERELIERIIRLDDASKQRVLEFVDTIENPRTYTALELLELPPEERERYIAWSFAAAANEDFETFEAYSEEDFDDYS